MNRWNKERSNPFQLALSYIRQRLGFIGGPRRIRTPDPLIRSLEYGSKNPCNSSLLRIGSWDGSSANSGDIQKDPAPVSPGLAAAMAAQWSGYAEKETAS